MQEDQTTDEWTKISYNPNNTHTVFWDLFVKKTKENLPSVYSAVNICHRQWVHSDNLKNSDQTLIFHL